MSPNGVSLWYFYLPYGCVKEQAFYSWCLGTILVRYTLIFQKCRSTNACQQDNCRLFSEAIDLCFLKILKGFSYYVLHRS